MEVLGLLPLEVYTQVENPTTPMTGGFLFSCEHITPKLLSEHSGLYSAHTNISYLHAQCISTTSAGYVEMDDHPFWGRLGVGRSLDKADLSFFFCEHKTNVRLAENSAMSQPILQQSPMETETEGHVLYGVSPEQG